MKKMWIVLLVGSLLFVGGDMVLAGVSSAAGKLLEPVMLLSQEEAKQLTGVSFEACTVKEQPAVGLKLCVYENDATLLQIGLTQAEFMDKKLREGGTTPQSIYLAIKDAFKDAASIEGVGDDNFIAPGGLHILKDGYYLTVSLGSLSKDNAKLKAVGMRVVENLSQHVKE
ncbi:MAG: hypothetical protein PHZ02_11945 [Desulfocapsaceae bacterium]|nr:hypothetical protein [Desulfocapsaceae bacterium]